MKTLSHNQEVLLTRQRHEADKAGLHFDYRIVVGDKALSWATKKELPEPGSAIILWEQPMHDKSYALSKKILIPKGHYGAGVTTLDFVRKGIINNPGEDENKFTLTTKSGDRFLFKKLPETYGKTAWLFKNLTTNKYLEKLAYSEYKSTFTHNGKEYDLNKIFERTKDLNSKKISLDKIKWILKYSGNLNKKRIEHADVSIPVLIYNMGDKKVVLDGAHRLANAFSKNLNEIPYKRVTKEMLLDSIIKK